MLPVRTAHTKTSRPIVTKYLNQSESVLTHDVTLRIFNPSFLKLWTRFLDIATHYTVTPLPTSWRTGTGSRLRLSTPKLRQ